MSDDDLVVRLPVKFKAPTPPDRMFKLVGPSKCFHDQFIVDEKLECVECAKCGERLSPMWVLKYLAGWETTWHAAAERYDEEMRRLSARERTRCQHCDKMTRISRR